MDFVWFVGNLKQNICFSCRDLIQRKDDDFSIIHRCTVQVMRPRMIKEKVCKLKRIHDQEHNN